MLEAVIRNKCKCGREGCDDSHSPPIVLVLFAHRPSEYEILRKIIKIVGPVLTDAILEGWGEDDNFRDFKNGLLELVKTHTTSGITDSQVSSSKESLEPEVDEFSGLEELDELIEPNP